jgi:1,4-dihydroxy-2-naphthoate octaprenyltransferase
MSAVPFGPADSLEGRNRYRVPHPTASGGALGKARIWLLAVRPKTLSASIVPVLVGTAFAYANKEARVMPALAALLGAVLIQVGTNFINDYYDFKKGADTKERLGPTRVTQSGLLSPGAVLLGGLLCFAAAFVIGVYLVAVGGWPIALIGLLSLLCGYAYTGGPVPLGYVGLGDLLVFVFFGLVAVGGTYFVQAHRLPESLWLAAAAVGSLATAILVVNNLRDIVTDAKADKRTLAVRFGSRAARREYAALLAIAYFAPVGLWASGLSGWLFLPWLSLPLAIRCLRLVLTQSGAALNPVLGQTARLEVVFGILLSIGLCLS